MSRALLARAMIGVGLLAGAGLILYGGWRLAAGNAPAPPQAATQQTLATAVVAARPIPRGQAIVAEDLSAIRIAGPPPAGVITSPSGAMGRIAMVDLAPQQLVLSSTLAAEPGQAGLAALVPAGQRAISINVDEEIAVANHIQVGDVVDIQVVLPASAVGRASGSGADTSEARALLQNIRVLAVGSPASEGDPSAPAGAARAARTVTVAMSPEQVSEFTLARSLGRYYLVLRNPADALPTPPTARRVADLRGAARPAPTVRPRPVAPRPPSSIELVVAGRREALRPGGAQ